MPSSLRQLGLLALLVGVFADANYLNHLILVKVLEAS